MPNLRNILGSGAALLTLSAPLPLAAQEPVQPVWQPAIYCAALDFTRAELLQRIKAPLPSWVGDAESADQNGRMYLRIAAEGLECPPQAQVNAMIGTALVGIEHRLAQAASYGIGPEISVMPLTSESELVCGLNFEPDLLEAARIAEAQTLYLPPCGWTQD